MDGTQSAQPHDDLIGDARTGLTRRQVGIAAAWAAPIIVMATAAPFASASVTDPSVDVAIQQSGLPGAVYNGSVTSANFEFSSTVTKTATLTATIIVTPSTRITISSYNDPDTNTGFSSPYTDDAGLIWVVTTGTNTITFVASNANVVTGFNNFNLPLPELVGTLTSTGNVIISYQASIDDPSVFASAAAGYAVSYHP